jgi:hypothetical protein
VTVTGTAPIWFYCGQIGHCQQGMVGVINEPASGNTLAVYEANAKKTTNTTNPSVIEGGVFVEVEEVTTILDSTEVYTLVSTAVSTGWSATTTDGVVSTVAVEVTSTESIVVETAVVGAASVSIVRWIVSLSFILRNNTDECQYTVVTSVGTLLCLLLF